MKKGFTLIEVVITMAIIAILAAIAIPLYSGYINRTKIVACNESMRVITQEYNLEIQSIEQENISEEVATQLRDDLLDDYGYTKVSDGIYQGPSSNNAYASVSVADNKLVTSCFLAIGETASPVYVNTEKAVAGFTASYGTLTGGWKSGDQLIANYAGDLEKVDTSLNLSTYGFPENLYWKANTTYSLQSSAETTEQKYIMFSTANSSKTTHDQWKGYFAYYDGTYYYSTSADGKGSSVVTGTKTSSEIATWLTTNGWVAI